MKENNVIFSSKTRLYTNFCFEEPKEEYVVTRAKACVSRLLGELSAILSDDAFIEGILDGGDSIDLGFTPNIKTKYTLNLARLDSSFVKWLKKIYQAPSLYIKSIDLVEDVDGSLAIDVDTKLKIPIQRLKELTESSDEDFNSKATKLKALYNVVVSAKYLIFKRLQQSLRLSPGIEIEDVCDVHLIEYKIDEETKTFHRHNLQVKLENSTVKVHWKLATRDLIG